MKPRRTRRASSSRSGCSPRRSRLRLSQKEGAATANTRQPARTVERQARHWRRRRHDPTIAAKTAELRKTFDEGVALSRAGKYDESVESFNKALAINPNCQDCFYNIGFAYAQKKEYDKAEENYKKALAVKADYAEAYNGLANIYNAQRKFDQAAEASAQASKLSAAAPGALQGGNADALYNEGVILWNGGKIADAKAKFQAAITANPNHAESHYQLGMALVNEGKLKEAGEEFNAYLKMAPEGPNAATAKALVAQLPQ